MRCRGCDYPLWNLPARQCPECGAAFTPSSFEFQPNAVRFCCPHCDQHYFGTDHKGHLVPRAFACVSCGRQVDMDEMILRPADGAGESAVVNANPWLNRQRIGRVKAWFRTIGQALVAPHRLIRGTPATATGSAWWFAAVTLPVYAILLALPLCALGAAIGGSLGPGGGAGAAQMLGVMLGVGAGYTIGYVLFMLVLIGILGACTHGLLRLGGPLTHGIGRTYQAWAFAAGASVLIVIPCFGSYVYWIWPLVSATIMVKAGHDVSGGRAAFATLAPPLAFIAGLIILYFSLIFVAMSQSAGTVRAGPGLAPPTATVVGETTILSESLRAWAIDHGGVGPTHAAELLGAGVEALDFVMLDSDTFESDVPVGPVSLETLTTMRPPVRARAIREAGDALPENVIAHRVGDFVFTYHGVDFIDGPQTLWTVIISPDPDTNIDPTLAPTVVGFADGTTRPLPDPFEVHLDRQNQLRAEAGLAPLPPPWEVTHDTPATGEPATPGGP